MENHITHSSCPTCGSKEEVYYCRNCDRYWCEDLGCPNASNTFVRNQAGLFVEVDISACKICKNKGSSC